MISILVTGAHSQLALALAHTQSGYKNLQVVFAPKNTLDITDLEQLCAYLSRHPIDYLINCAAYNQVDAAESDQAQAFAVNAQGPLYLAFLAKACPFTLVHISTDYVFGGELAQPLQEDMLTDPINYYGYTKLAGEQAVLAQNILIQNPLAYIIRTSWLYSSMGNNFLTRFLARSAKESTITMAYDQVASPTYAHDLAEAIWTIILKHRQNPAQYLPGIYHYANEGVASRYDFAWAISQYVGLSCQIRPGLTQDFPQVAQRPAYSVLSKDKVKKTFGLNIAHWQDSLSRCMYHLKKNP